VNTVVARDIGAGLALVQFGGNHLVHAGDARGVITEVQ
jgi:hypothetical protein